MEELKEGKNEAEGREKRHVNGVFLFADGVDVVLMTLGTFGAVADGCSVNCLLLFASSVMNTLGSGKAQNKQVDFMHDVEKVVSFYNFDIHQM